MHFVFSSFTHIGHIRKTNQDSLYIKVDDSSQFSIFMVADGMGGHNAGDIASKMAVESMSDFFKNNLHALNSNIIKKVIESINYANMNIYNYSYTNKNLMGMGTTITLACLKETQAYIGHVGDSRAYIINDNEVRQITRDHSLVQELYEKGIISKEQMNTHPKRNILTRALGVEPSVNVDCYETELKMGDMLLLCTDGLNLYIDPYQCTELFRSDYTVEEIVSKLGQRALDAGGADNITFIVTRLVCDSNLRDNKC